MTHAAAIRAADTAFSRLIRKTASDPHTGVAKCITCGQSAHWSQLDAGHYITRAKLATRYEPANVWPQCPRCNRLGNGEREKYRAQLTARLGAETVEQLHRQSEQPANYTTEDLTKLAALFRQVEKTYPW